MHLYSAFANAEIIPTIKGNEWKWTEIDQYLSIDNLGVVINGSISFRSPFICMNDIIDKTVKYILYEKKIRSGKISKEQAEKAAKWWQDRLIKELDAKDEIKSFVETVVEVLQHEYIGVRFT